MAAPAFTLLALDTSTELACVGLHGAHGTDLWEGPGGARASLELLPRMQAMLDARGLRLADLHALAFGRGPGAFTGLRTACAVAQGVALGSGCPVVPVDSLMLVAEQAGEAAQAWLQEACGASGLSGVSGVSGVSASGQVPDIGVAMDARMGELYAARYVWREDAPGGWAPLAAPALCRPQELPAAWGGWPPFVAGSGLALLQALPGASAVRALATGDAPSAPAARAAALVRLALRLHASGVALPASQALPLYLRDQVALTTAQRAAAAAGAALPERAA